MFLERFRAFASARADRSHVYVTLVTWNPLALFAWGREWMRRDILRFLSLVAPQYGFRDVNVFHWLRLSHDQRIKAKAAPIGHAFVYDAEDLGEFARYYASEHHWEDLP